MSTTVRAKMRCSHVTTTSYRQPEPGEQLPRTYHKNYQGLPMPEFDDLGEAIQSAWRSAVAAVAAEVTR